MNSRKGGLQLGHVGLFIVMLGGIWLLLAPTWVGFSAHRLPSRMDEVAGAALIVISAVTFLLQWIFGMTELIHRHRGESRDR